MNEEKNSPKTEAAATPPAGEEAASQKENIVAAAEDAAKESDRQPENEAAAEKPDDASHSVDVALDPKAEESVQEGAESAASTQQPPEGEAENGVWSALFNGFAKGGPLILLAAMICLAWHDFYRPDNTVYCPPEFRTITAFLHCVAQGSWLTPIGLDNGAWIAPQWPGFLWFVGLLAWIPELGASSLLLPVAEFCAAAIAVCAIWWLAHASKFGSRAAFAAGMMALCCPLFAPLPHFMGPGALAAGLMLLALLFFLKGWRKDYSLLFLPLGFIFTALAGLTGGLAHFITPLAASCCFLIWTGKFQRAQRLDALIGFICLLAIIGAWLGVIMIKGENPDYLPGLFGAYSPAWPPTRHWWFAIAAGFLGSLPWLLTIFGVSWVRVLGKSGEAVRNSRNSNGSAMIWTALAIMAVISIWTPNFHAAAVAICSLLLILLGKAFMRMPSAGNRFFFFLAALITTVAGLIICAMHFEFSQTWLLEITGLPVPDIARQALLHVSAFLFIGGILAIGGIIGFYFAKRFCHGGGLLYALLIAILLCQPGRLFVVPELAADPALPVRTFDAIKAEVESRLASAGQRDADIAPATPMAQPAPAIQDTPANEPDSSQPPAPAPESAEPPAPQGAADMERPTIQPPSRGSTIPPANQGREETIIIMEKELPADQAPQPAIPPTPAEIPQPTAPETAVQPGETPQIVAPESPAPENVAPPVQEPGATVPSEQTAGAAQPDATAPQPVDEGPVLDLPEKSPAGEEMIPENSKPGPDMPDHPVTGESDNNSR